MLTNLYKIVIIMNIVFYIKHQYKNKLFRNV